MNSCDVTWVLYNSASDSSTAILLDGALISNPPPSSRTNIEAVLPCADSNDRVVLELYQGSTLLRSQIETAAPYFLFGNRGSNVNDGSIVAGTYRVRALLDGVYTPFTAFTLEELV